MSCKLREFIRNIRAAKTAADERAVVSKECAEIRTAFKEGDGRYRHRNVAKVLFISMLGYPTQFAQLECLKLLASPRFAEKRVGYLGLSCLLDEQSEVLMLATNSIKNDLQHPNQYVNGLALTALGNIGTGEMCGAIMTQVEDLLRCSNPFIRKKAALCGVRVVKRVGDCEEKLLACLPALLADRNHGVLISACALITALAERDPSLVSTMRTHIPTLVKSLKACLTAGYAHAAEYDIAGITDPLLQCRLLRVLALLAKGDAESSASLSDVLAHVATNTEGAKNVGNSVLYECVRTIMTIEDDPGLRVLGVNILGRFLSSRELNVKYVALGTLQQVVRVDSKAVMRHRDILLDCLKDQDLSLRRRAVEVLFCLITDDNVRGLVKELLNFLLMLNDAEFKQFVVNKIAVAASRHAPSTRWQIDTLLKLMTLGGDAVDDAITYSFVDLVVSTPPLHSYVVHKCYFSFQHSLSNNAALWQAGVYCVGEFGDLLVKPEKGHLLSPNGGGSMTEDTLAITPRQVADLLISVADQLSSFPKAKQGVLTQTLLTAAAKLAARLPSQRERLVGLLKRFETSNNVEVQQRSSEYMGLLEWDEWKENTSIFDRMPVCDAKLSSRRSLSSLGSGSFASLLSGRSGSAEALSPAPASRPVGDVWFDATEVPLNVGSPLAASSGRDDSEKDERNDRASQVSHGDSLFDEKPAQRNGIAAGSGKKTNDLLDLDDLLNMGYSSESRASPQGIPPHASGAPSSGAGVAGGSAVGASSGDKSIDMLADLLEGTSVSLGGGAAVATPAGNSAADMRGSTSAQGGGSLDSLFGLSPSQLSLPSGTSLSAVQSPTSADPFDSFLASSAKGVNSGATPGIGSGLLGTVGSENGAFPPMNVLNEDDLCVDFICSRQGQSGSTATLLHEASGSEKGASIRAEFRNRGQAQITNLLFEAAVPKYLKLTIQPATGTSVPPTGTGVVTQDMCVCFGDGASAPGAKPLLMKCRISFNKDGAMLQKFVNVGDFPAGLLA
ncbi:adaptin n terminal region domain-containing protein [Toxoplasma gondii TgCatPRC2]|uniref:AP-1 complex subunit gamma n=13 Tax=Toxoplasma gondii TaxID=5811 RepID=B6K954_TOXGV|nr:adaptin n terminal region domain-containing protein [Toxoplasma gondii ME49]ESS35164.1 adaptin n terminal region domain-containing protein [Toxoplasma gondii VEG]KFG37512.1 adaptin n terminal region domain-containing protein [Toxoplasma gondii GAB2-2007-GAL-DOM2]KFG56156.1 adaptin n terminal region domain-containing protein [Toxoplasma gondii FOU]KYF48447.1 adaptin n terminal region domain-containing protein [Toxoplasma gondii ARI]KYK65451.1 adaptin n terminal region domain-containing prote|eukprot:XP_002364578.1 adaptin n terminal region domain-containing protein [Toxoplasma gondii ME49]